MTSSDAVLYAERVSVVVNLCVLRYLTNFEDINLDSLSVFAASKALYVKSKKKCSPAFLMANEGDRQVSSS